MRYASTKGQEMKAPFNNNRPTQTGDVMVNPRNPVNPDSKPGVRGKFILKPDEMNDLTATNAIVP